MGLEDVIEALAVWHDHGAPQLYAKAADCKETLTPGDVHITDGSHEVGFWARTIVAYTTHRNGGAVIELTTNDLDTLLHEVGHIWVGHVDGTHVMSPYSGSFSRYSWGGVRKALEEGYPKGQR